MPARATSKRKASQASEEETPAKKAAPPTPAPESTPANSESSTEKVEQKVSTSGRALKPKKFAEGMISSPKPTPSAPADADKVQSCKKYSSKIFSVDRVAYMNISATLALGQDPVPSGPALTKKQHYTM